MGEIRYTRATGVSDAEATRSYGHDVCPHWLAPMLDNPVRRWLTGTRRMVEEHVTGGMTVLDIGCGSGALLPDLARAVGTSGTVICADIQAGMLSRVARKAARLGVTELVRLHQCSQEGLGLEPGVADLAIAYWVLHESPDPPRLLAEIHASLKSGGRLLLVEPGVHVSRDLFEKTLEQAREAGFELVGRPTVRLSHAALLGVVGLAIGCECAGSSRGYWAGWGPPRSFPRYGAYPAPTRDERAPSIRPLHGTRRPSSRSAEHRRPAQGRRGRTSLHGHWAGWGPRRSFLAPPHSAPPYIPDRQLPVER